MSDAFSVETLARQIIVRYRGTGHTRFCPARSAMRRIICAGDRGKPAYPPGVYRATLYRSQGKLSVYYDPHACGLNDVARCLHGALAKPAAQIKRGTAIASMTQRLHVAQPMHWLKEKTENLKAKAKLLSQFASAQTKGKSVLQNMLSEKAIINFSNDVVVFYLIKTHWEMISQKWLKEPLKYRNAWLTTFYLVFLLVRYRKQAAKKP